MSNALRHPDADTLLRYADGEMPARQARKIKSHLESCWQCRAGLEEMQGVVGECVRYRQNVLQPLMPAPPAGGFWRARNSAASTSSSIVSVSTTAL